MSRRSAHPEIEKEYQGTDDELAAARDLVGQADRDARRDDTPGSPPYKVIAPDGTLHIVSDDPDDIYGNLDKLPEGTRVLDTPAGTL